MGEGTPVRPPLSGCRRCGLMTGRNTRVSRCTHGGASSGSASGDAGLEGWCLLTTRAGGTPPASAESQAAVPGMHMWVLGRGRCTSDITHDPRWGIITALEIGTNIHLLSTGNTSLKLISYTSESLVWKRHYKLRACWGKKKKEKRRKKISCKVQHIFIHMRDIIY